MLFRSVHIDNYDNGIHYSNKLGGLGLTFKDSPTILKKIGLDHADKVVAVSPSFLLECEFAKPEAPNSVRTMAIAFKQAKLNHKSVGITNGFDFKKYNHFLNDNFSNSYIHTKNRLKSKLKFELSGSRGLWTINPHLPIILFIGRYSPEKGVNSFTKLIYLLEKNAHIKANFIAIGRGYHPEVMELILKKSRQQANVFVTLDQNEQDKYGPLMRACADFMFIPSYREACGLISLEGLANGALCISSGAGGLKDIVQEISQDLNQGNGFIYNHLIENSLEQVLIRAIGFWNQMDESKKNKLCQRLIEDSKKFDWAFSEGPSKIYHQIYSSALEDSYTENRSAEPLKIA